MSSLMQFNGHSDQRGVGLQFVLIRKVPVEGLGFHHTTDVDAERFKCPLCKGEHSPIHVAYRKPRGMCGCWVVFQYNGEEHVPDLSIPISVEKLPRDAVRLSDEESSKYWHS